MEYLPYQLVSRISSINSILATILNMTGGRAPGSGESFHFRGVRRVPNFSNPHGLKWRSFLGPKDWRFFFFQRSFRAWMFIRHYCYACFVLLTGMTGWEVFRIWSRQLFCRLWFFTPSQSFLIVFTDHVPCKICSTRGDPRTGDPRGPRAVGWRNRWKMRWKRGTGRTVVES